MLEPMVENAIFHGIAPKEEFGHLKISAKREGEMIKILVSDNGVGMDEDMIEKILEDSEVPKGGIHKIGIANVRKRIKQIYGYEYDIAIKSTVGQGTEVSVVLPYQQA
jgi:two-component system sensor histidine kinase YesM